MRKKIFFGTICLLMTACARPNIVEIPVSRSHVFYGQSVEDLFTNFGPAKKAARYSYDVIAYTFKDVDLVQEDWDRKVHFCDLTVYTRDNLVIDWCYDGNHCRIKEASVFKYLDRDLEEQTDRYPDEEDD